MLGLPASVVSLQVARSRVASTYRIDFVDILLAVCTATRQAGMYRNVKASAVCTALLHADFIARAATTTNCLGMLPGMHQAKEICDIMYVCMHANV